MIAFLLFYRKEVESLNIINELDSTCGISDEELTRRFKESIRLIMK